MGQLVRKKELCKKGETEGTDVREDPKKDERPIRKNPRKRLQHKKRTRNLQPQRVPRTPRR